MAQGTSRPLVAAVLGVLVAGSAVAGDEQSWFQGSFEEALEAAKAQDKGLMVFFSWADSENARQMRANTLAHRDVVRELEQYVVFDCDYQTPGMYDHWQNWGVTVSPTSLFLNASGSPEDILVGLISAGEFTEDLERIRNHGEGTLTALRAAVTQAEQGSEDAIEARMALAGKLSEFALGAEHDEVILSIAELDPDAETEAGCTAHLMVFQQQAAAHFRGIEGKKAECAEGGEGQECADGEECSGDKAECAGEGKCEEGCEGDCEGCEERKAKMRELAAELDLEPLYRLAKKAKQGKSRHQIWDAVAGYESQAGDRVKFLAALGEAEKYLGEEEVAVWCSEAAWRVMEQGEKPSSKEKKRAVELATRSVQAAEAKRRAARGHEAEWNPYLAERLATLASAQAFSGKKRDAKKTLDRCLELHDCDEYRTLLTSLK